MSRNKVLRLLALLLTFVMSLSGCVSGGVLESNVYPEAYQDGLEAFGNEFEIDLAAEWSLGDFDGGAVVLDKNIANGSLVLADGILEAVYTSPSIVIDDEFGFRQALLSWNADCAPGTEIEIWGAGFNGEEWDDYTHVVTWSPHIERKMMDSLVTVADGKTADLFKVRLVLRRESAELPSPVFRYLHGTFRNETDWGSSEYPKVYKNTDKWASEEDINNYIAEQGGMIYIESIPQYSQLVRDPRIGNSICSPISVCMLINGLSADEGKPLDILPEENARATFDYNVGIFGQWAMATAAAGSYGFKAYVNWTDIEGLKRYIADGTPCVVSMAYSNDPNDPLYLPGAEYSTGGHLFTVVGWKIDEDGNEYAVCHDPFAVANNTVYREYPVEYFNRLWKSARWCTTYVVEPGMIEGAGMYPSQRIEATLRETDEKGEFLLYIDGELYSMVNNGSLWPYVFYTTMPDATAESPFIYFPAANGKDTVTLDYDDLSNKNFKFYAVDDYGVMFTVDYDSIEYTVINDVAKVTSDGFSVNDNTIWSGRSALTAGMPIDEFTDALIEARGSEVKIFSADKDVTDAVTFAGTDSKTSGVLDEDDYLCVLAEDGETFRRYAIKYGDALMANDGAAFEFNYISLTADDYPFVNPVTGNKSTGAITYKSENKNVAVIDAETGEITPWNRGVATVTATIAADENYFETVISFKMETIGGYIEKFTFGGVTAPVPGETPDKNYYAGDSSAVVRTTSSFTGAVNRKDVHADKLWLYTHWSDPEADFAYVQWSSPDGVMGADDEFEYDVEYTARVVVYTYSLPGNNSGFFFDTSSFGSNNTAMFREGAIDNYPVADGEVITEVSYSRRASYMLWITITYAPVSKPAE